jgi:hypothetical protein
MPGQALAAADTIPGYSVPTSPQCCKELTSSSTPAASAIAHFGLGLDITGLLIDVGLSCSPITVVGNNWSVLRLAVTYWEFMYLVLWQRGDLTQMLCPRPSVGRPHCLKLHSLVPGIKQRECYRNMSLYKIIPVRLRLESL